MFIALEGVDTSGKSTQIALLRLLYPSAIFTQEPTSGTFGTKIRSMTLFGEIDNATQTLLFAADRASHAKTTLFPNRHRLIISDRSLISGIAYARELDFDLVVRLNCAISPLPDLVIVLETSEAILEKRLNLKACDNIESCGVGYLLGVQKRIFRAIEALGIECVKIPCDLEKDKICEKICQEIDARIENSAPKSASKAPK